jgi:hypothetical protein
MAEGPFSTPEEERDFHTYSTHRIPWYVHLMWIWFSILLIWYVVRYAIPSARSYF